MEAGLAGAEAVVVASLRAEMARKARALFWHRERNVELEKAL